MQQLEQQHSAEIVNAEGLANQVNPDIFADMDDSTGRSSGGGETNGVRLENAAKHNAAILEEARNEGIKEDNLNTPKKDSALDLENAAKHNAAILEEARNERIKKDNLNTSKEDRALIKGAIISINKNPTLTLDLSKIKSTTLELEEALATRFKGVVDLSGLTTITPLLASALSQSKAHTVKLNGVKGISNNARELLKGFRGNRLELNLLMSTHPRLYDLSGFNCKQISLNNRKGLNELQASNLAKFPGEALILDGLSSLNDKTAKELAKFKGTRLSLQGIKSMDEETFNELSNFYYMSLPNVPNALKVPKKEKGINLTLGLVEMNSKITKKMVEIASDRHSIQSTTKNLKKISVQTAEQLAQSKEYTLDLRGLEYVGPKTAAELTKFKGGTLLLSGLSDKVPPNAINELAKFKGTIYVSPESKMADTLDKARIKIKNYDLKIIEYGVTSKGGGTIKEIPR